MDSTHEQTGERQRLPKKQPIRSGEPHRHLCGRVEAVEIAGDDLIVESNGRRLTVPRDATFVDVQRRFYSDCGVWVNHSADDGEPAEEWWDRVTADAALSAIGGGV